jgi:cytoskeletal protein CcmA (bactofilin family)
MSELQNAERRRNMKKPGLGYFGAQAGGYEAAQNTMPSTTIIGQGIKLELVKLSGSETVVINGALLGDIDLDAALIIGETGSVVGNIRARNVEISGKVKGSILCERTAYLTSTAYLRGVISTKALKTDEGARINGQCRMEDERAEQIAIELYEQEGKLEFDFSQLSEAIIPEKGIPAATG